MAVVQGAREVAPDQVAGSVRDIAPRSLGTQPAGSLDTTHRTIDTSTRNALIHAQTHRYRLIRIVSQTQTGRAWLIDSASLSQMQQVSRSAVVTLTADRVPPGQPGDGGGPGGEGAGAIPANLAHRAEKSAPSPLFAAARESPGGFVPPLRSSHFLPDEFVGPAGGRQPQGSQETAYLLAIVRIASS